MYPISLEQTHKKKTNIIMIFEVRNGRDENSIKSRFSFQF
jgi:hypothetical protein